MNHVLMLLMFTRLHSALVKVLYAAAHEPLRIPSATKAPVSILGTSAKGKRVFPDQLVSGSCQVLGEIAHKKESTQKKSTLITADSHNFYFEGENSLFPVSETEKWDSVTW